MSAPDATILALRRENDALCCENKKLRARIEELHEAFGTTVPLPTGFCIGPTPRKSWRMLCLLAECSDVSREMALRVLYPDPDARPDVKALNMIVFHLRQALKRHGINIETRWGFGWSFSPAMRVKALALIEKLTAGQNPAKTEENSHEQPDRS
jgi:hypothetical protein